MDESTGVQVKAANVVTMRSERKVTKIFLRIQGVQFVIEANVLGLALCDMVLGVA